MAAPTINPNWVKTIGELGINEAVRIQNEIETFLKGTPDPNNPGQFIPPDMMNPVNGYKLQQLSGGMNTTIGGVSALTKKSEDGTMANIRNIA
jgi:hypothetical protein